MTTYPHQESRMSNGIAAMAIGLIVSLLAAWWALHR
jgi:hypothetical protein